MLRIVTVVASFLFVAVALGLAHNASADDAALYKKNCKRCHAMDGTGTKNGEPLKIMKSLKLTDPKLLSLVNPESKAKSDPDLLKMIVEGKDKMPGFVKPAGGKKAKLTQAEADSMLKYVRQLQSQAK